MSLPVSAEFPMVPFSQYDPSVPPAVPQVQVLPTTGHILPLVSATVANEASIKAPQSAARMFCYNLLVNYFWNNKEFAEVVKLATDLVALQCMKGALRSPEAGVQDAVAQVLTLYTSNLIFLYPDLKSMVAPQVLNAAFGNVTTLNNLKQEISSMYSHTPGFGHHNDPRLSPGGYAHTPGVHGFPGGGHPGPGFGHPGHMHPGHMHPSMHPAMHPSHYPQHHAPVHTGHQGGGFGSGFHGGATMSRLGSDPNAEGEAIRQDRFFTRPRREEEQRPVQIHQQQQPQAPAPAPKVTAVSTTLVIEKGSEMDRDKHRVPTLGQSYAFDSSARGVQFAESAQALVTEKPAEDTDKPHHVHPALIMEPCLEQAIVSGRSKQFEHQAAQSAVNLFRCFAFTTVPMICVEDVTPYVKNLREATTFAQLVIKLKSMATSLGTKTDDKRYTDNVVTFLTQFDNLLTELVNEFLCNKLRLKLSIDSFTDDVSDLPDYLHRKYGPEYSRALSVFEGELILSVLEKLSDTQEQEMMNLFNVDESLNVAIFPVNYSLTYTFMTKKELGYKIPAGQAVVIDKDTAPSLYMIAQSLEAHKRQMEITPMYDLLITADNARYKLSRNYAVEGEYLIAQA